VYRPFSAPGENLGTLDALTAATLIGAASDLALVVDSEGVIRDLVLGSEDLDQRGCEYWIGKHWVHTVTAESRPKIEAMLRDADSRKVQRPRQVNHPSPLGADLPVLYSTIRLEGRGGVVALGRDLRATAAIQQRLVDVQSALERDYARLRHTEVRFRMLFQLASEALLIVDATNQLVVEANPAAAHYLGRPVERIVGRVFPQGFEFEAVQGVNELLAKVRAGGRGGTLQARLAEGADTFSLAASLYRQDGSTYFLVRLFAGPGAAAPEAAPAGRPRILDFIEQLPDGLVLTDEAGRVLMANRAFLDLAELATEAQARGESLERWLGRAGTDLGVLTASLRQHGSVRLFATQMRGEYGSLREVELSAVSVPGEGEERLGFVVRDVGRRPSAGAARRPELPRSVEQLTELVGRMPLRELVRETTDMIERLCIEAALEMAGDNRVSAAEVLGLSRQSLYVKLRRYGLGDLAGQGE
jgi:transcriptional regulator PpsR